MTSSHKPPSHRRKTSRKSQVKDPTKSKSSPIKNHDQQNIQTSSGIKTNEHYYTENSVPQSSKSAAYKTSATTASDPYGTSRDVTAAQTLPSFYYHPTSEYSLLGIGAWASPTSNPGSSASNQHSAVPDTDLILDPSTSCHYSQTTREADSPGIGNWEPSSGSKDVERVDISDWVLCEKFDDIGLGELDYGCVRRL